MAHPIKKMAIISGYFNGESYGLLGPQMAATIIEGNSDYECIVIPLTREDDKAVVKNALAGYFGQERPIVGFSHLCGRGDLFAFAAELKAEGAITILAGPQADVDYVGETGWQEHSHRFPGVSSCFSFALHGPAQQLLPFLKNPDTTEYPGISRSLHTAQGHKIHRNPPIPWDERFLRRVRWDNMFRVESRRLIPLCVSTAQVLQHLGCPYASRGRRVEVDYPAYFKDSEKKTIGLDFKGCSFCDVAADKGFHGALDIETVLAQIQCLPETQDGRKIPFELINENALAGLPHLMEEAQKRGQHISQINLTLRADWFLQGEASLREALRIARRTRTRILLSSLGLETFDDQILRNLNKGLNVETNLQAVRLAREIKEKFPFQWAYSRAEGAVHGFIHPTPWDTPKTAALIQRTLDTYRLDSDILPSHSVPLIIHHASGLADWIREIEEREKVRFERYVSVIGWWEEAILE